MNLQLELDIVRAESEQNPSPDNANVIISNNGLSLDRVDAFSNTLALPAPTGLFLFQSFLRDQAKQELFETFFGPDGLDALTDLGAAYADLADGRVYQGDQTDDTLGGPDGFEAQIAGEEYDGSGNDLLIGDPKPDSAFEDDRAGPDGSFSNTGDPLDGDDLLEGFGGEDALEGRGGEDTLRGGDGADRLDGDAGDDMLEGGAGVDTLIGGYGDDTMDGGADNDSLSGDGGSDSLDGGEGSDTLGGGDGGDTLDGGGGNDSLNGDAWRDTLCGRTGDDTLDGGDERDTLAGGAGDDSLYGRDGEDDIFGQLGDDLLVGGGGNDLLDDFPSGVPGVDFSEGGNDTLLGEAGNDVLDAGEGNDLLEGGVGNDLILDDAGRDTMLGGAGNDELRSFVSIEPSGNDLFDGGSGTDTLVLTGFREDYLIEQVPGAAGEFVLTGPLGEDTLRGVERIEFRNDPLDNDDETVIDDIAAEADGVRMAQFSIAADDADRPEGSGGPGDTTIFSFQVTREDNFSGSATVDWAVSGEVDDTDFAGPLSGSVTLPDSVSGVPIVLEVNEDRAPEPDETFTVTLSNPSTGSIATASATGTIRNDDAPVTLDIAPDTAAGPEGDDGQTAFTFTVTRSGNTSLPAGAD